MSSGFIHGVAGVSISFLFKVEKYSFVYRYHLLLIHSTIDGRLGCSHVLASANNAVMNMGVEICFGYPAFSSFGYILRSGIAGSYGNSIFKFLRDHHTILHNPVPFSLPTTVYKSPYLSTSSPTLVSLIVFLIVFFLKFYLFIWQREITSRQRGRQREEEAGSLLSREPDAGLHPRTLRSWPEPKAEILIHWATQAPLLIVFW